MKLEELRGYWALVTGASSGIGREFCIQLAELGMNLVMVARRRELMEKLSDELINRYDIKTVIIVSDLSLPGQALKIKEETENNDVKIRLLCNNAGIALWGEFEKVASAEAYEKMVQLNCGTVTSMTRCFFDHLGSFPSSAIINISSPATFQPVPFLAVYAASKSFVYSLGVALYEEWKKYGIVVKTIIPGPTNTELLSLSNLSSSTIFPTVESPASVVKKALASLTNDKPVIATVKGTVLQRVLCSVFPVKLVVKKAGKMFSPYLKKKQ